MKILIDTHYLLWLFTDTSKIADKIKEALLSTDNEIYYSQASLWEISIKYSIGKLTLKGIAPEEFFQEVQDSFSICKSLKNEELISSYKLPREHKDPFDRIIIWQAIKNGMVLLSVDSKMDYYINHGLVIFE